MKQVPRNYQPGEQPTKLERLAGRTIRSDKHEDSGLLYRAIGQLGQVNARRPLLVEHPLGARLRLYRPPGK